MKCTLGQILVQDDLVRPERLKQVLQVQKHNVEVVGWRLLGELLIESGDISKRELMIALERQSNINEISFFSILPHPSVQSKSKRALDLIGGSIGCFLLVAVLPIIALAIILDTPGSVFFAQHRVGLRGRQFRIFKFRTMAANADREKWKVSSGQNYKFFDNRCDPRITLVGSFLRRTHLDELPQFINVLSGDMSLVGTRPPTLDEVAAYSEDDWQRLAIKPGMTGLWQTNPRKYVLDFESVKTLDMTYIKRWKHSLDLQIILKTIFQVCSSFLRKRAQSKTCKVPRSKVQLLNIDIDNLTQSQLLQKLNQGVVFTPNVDHLMKLQRDCEFFNVYSKADFKVCDSQILIYASHFIKQPIREKISGSDFFPAFCRYHQHNESISIFLLGGADGVAKKAQTRINHQLGRPIIIEAHAPSFGFIENEQECLEIVERINRCQPSVLAVGVGAPNQEKWIIRYKDLMPSVEIFLAIGATIDFEAGNKDRSPQWVSKAGFEWLHRLLTEPRRLWKRYLVDDFPFFFLLLKQKLGRYKSPWDNQIRPSKPTTQTFKNHPSNS